MGAQTLEERPLVSADGSLQELLRQHEEAVVSRIDTLIREQFALNTSATWRSDLAPMMPINTHHTVNTAQSWDWEREVTCMTGGEESLNDRHDPNGWMRPQDKALVKGVAATTSLQRPSSTSGGSDKVFHSSEESGGMCAKGSAGVDRGGGGSSDRIQKSKNPVDVVAGALELWKKPKVKERKDFQHTKTAMLLQKFCEKHPIRGFLRRMTIHPLFDTFFAAVVIVSVVMIGWEIQVKAEDPNNESKFFMFTQVACCFFFMVELCLRAGSQGITFLYNKEYKWNIFDLVCVVTMMVDLSTEMWVAASTEEKGTTVNSAVSGRVLRVLRLMRIVRALRIMRATRASREFRKMSFALQYSAQTLFWALLLLGFVMYFFATTFTQAAADSLVAEGLLPHQVPSQSSLALLVEMYGSIPRSFRSLFMAVSSGRDWHELLSPLSEHTHWIFSVLFVIFIAVTVFGIMNVLTSVFVESALQSVQHYKDLLIQESMKSKKMYVDHLREVFHEIDTDDSGSIAMEEMQIFLEDPQLCQYLESMDIQPDDARTLFRLLDKDESGTVSIEEFCQGCLRLKGDAKSFDIHCIIFENHRLLHKWKEYMVYMETGFMPNVQKTIEECISKQIKAIEEIESPLAQRRTRRESTRRNSTSTVEGGEGGLRGSRPLALQVDKRMPKFMDPAASATPSMALAPEATQPSTPASRIMMM